MITIFRLEARPEPLAELPEVEGIDGAGAVEVEGEVRGPERSPESAKVDGIHGARAVSVAEQAVRQRALVVTAGAVAVAVERAPGALDLRCHQRECVPAVDERTRCRREGR